MKKLIAISVVFALVAGVAFAVDLSGEVIASVNVIEADSATGSSVTASGFFKHIRISGGGELADGKFGGWLRIDPTGDGVGVGAASTEISGDWYTTGNPLVAGIAWWKPIEQLKLSFGGNPDGIFAKEGNAAWMFYQQISDTAVVDPGNAWGGGYGGLNMRQAFFGGFADNRLYIEITPVDIVSINIALPFFGGGNWDHLPIENVFKGTIAQVDLNMSFGNIAFTYRGNSNIKASNVYGFFSLTAIDNLQIDFGLGADFQETSPIALGIAVKYGQDSWGIKFRTLFAIPTRKDNSFGMLFDVLPYFIINDSFKVCVSAGMNLGDIDDLTSGSGWHVNPYIEVGEDWGPKFFAGIKVFTKGGFTGGPTIEFAVPIAIALSF